MVPEKHQDSLYNHTVIFFKNTLDSFRKSKLNDIRKFKNLLKSLLNLSRNEVTSKCNYQKKLSEIERAFYTDFQQN